MQRTIATALAAAVLASLTWSAAAQEPATAPPVPGSAQQQADWQRPRLERLFGPQGALFQQGLDMMGLTSNEFRIDLADMEWISGQTSYRLPIVDTFLGDPWKLSPYSHALTDQLLELSGSSVDVLVAAQARLGQSVRLNIPQYNPLDPYKARVAALGENALGTALYELTSDVKWQDPAHPAQVPRAVADSAALFCLVLPDVLEQRRLALEVPLQRLGLDPQETFERVVELAINRENSVSGSTDSGMDEPENVALLEQLADNVDFSRLNAGATLLALCAEDMARTLKAAEAEWTGRDFSFIAATRYGLLQLNGSKDDKYGTTTAGPLASPPLLIVDTGGNDTFLGAAGTTSWAQPVAVCLAFGGFDMYTDGLPEWPGVDSQRGFRPSQGCGIFGYGILLDFGEGGMRAAGEFGQGCGIFGTGILRSGSDSPRDKDVYIGGGHVQGSGWFGTGVLIDNAGDDTYKLFQFGQGYGGTLGVGVLVDNAGHDVYYAEPGKEGDAPFSGPHSPVINLNFAQGFAFGRRADLVDGHSWAGGIGILADGAGNDDYTAGIYALGSAYWHCLGICADKGGDDRYTSAHYTMGAPPHFAVGCFLDDTGNDSYLGYLRQTSGHGRDFCLGWFEDGGGDDYYQASMLSLGAGDECAIGVLWDKGGDDTYLLFGEGLGQTRSSMAAGLRSLQLCAGLFIDGGGRDRYLQIPTNIERVYDEAVDGPFAALAPFSMMGDGMSWTRGDSLGAPHARSAGVDAP